LFINRFDQPQQDVFDGSSWIFFVMLIKFSEMLGCIQIVSSRSYLYKPLLKDTM